jgi:acetolactate synthase I/II/III large subunit
VTTPPLLDHEVPTPVGVMRALEQAGIEYVFGMSGGDTGRLVRVFTQEPTSIQMITVKHESLGSVMAEVYGRLRGRPGVLLGQGPWALGLGVLGVLEAKLSSSPLIILTDFTDSSGFVQHGLYQVGTGGHGAWDARQSYGGLTKQVFEARTPAEAVQSVQFACKHALTGERGPVAVIFSGQSLAGTVGPDSEPRLYATKSYLSSPSSPAHTGDVQLAAQLIHHASRPVLIAGNGVRISQAHDQLAGLVEELDLPVATTAAGKGVFPESHPLALGVFGNFGVPVANEAVAKADLIVAVGTKLGASDTARENPNLLNPARQTFIQLDVEPLNAAWTFPTEHVLIGDAATLLLQLRSATAGTTAGGRDRVAALRERLGYFDLSATTDDAGPLPPEYVIAELQAALGTRGIVTCDAGENRIFMTHFFQTQAIESFVSAPGSGPMGFAIPAALATKLLHPDQPVVAVAGDGGFAMTMSGLLTAIEYELPIIVLVLNNAALGWVVHGGTLPENGPWREFDFARIAEGMGCRGIRVRRPEELAVALSDAMAHQAAPTVIDVWTSSATSFRDVTSALVWDQRAEADTDAVDSDDGASSVEAYRATS